MSVVSIKEKSIKIKGLEVTEAHITIGILLVTALLSFYAGRLSGATSSVLPDHIPMTMTHTTPIAVTAPSDVDASTTVRSVIKTFVATSSTATGAYVGSKKGTKYHLPSCPGASRISDANKIWFTSKEDAASKGYAPASNCKGI